jgi:SulP family sulfate permease
MTAPEGYGWSRLGADLCGGLTAAMLAVPYGLAMAALRRQPPVTGVWTSILTGPVIAAAWSNPMLIGGPMVVTVPLAVQRHGPAGAAQLSMLPAGIMIASARSGSAG